MTGQGYQIRPPTDDDINAVLELQVACDVDEHGEPDSTIEDLATQWGQRSFDLQRDAWLAVDRDEQIVAYAWVEERTPNVDIEADVLVHPAHRRGDLGRELVGRVGRRAAEHVVGATPDARMHLGVFCAAVNEWKRVLLTDAGFAPARAFFRMSIDLAGPVDPAPLPAHLELRVFEPSTDARAVHTALDEAFADEFRARRQAHEDWEQRLLKRPDFDPALWLVAWDGGDVAGVVAAYDFGDIGWVQGLGVRAPWRGRGLGLALLTHAFAALYARGRPTVGLGVDSENESGAGRLYERAGMHVDQRWIFYERTLEPA